MQRVSLTQTMNIQLLEDQVWRDLFGWDEISSNDQNSDRFAFLFNLLSFCTYTNVQQYDKIKVMLKT